MLVDLDVDEGVGLRLGVVMPADPDVNEEVGLHPVSDKRHWQQNMLTQLGLTLID